MSHPRTRRTVIGVALAALGLAVGPAAGLAPAVSSAASPGLCDSSGDSSAARVAGGTAVAKDPNTLSAAQAEAADRALRDKVSSLVKQGKLRADGTAKGSAITVRTYVHVITRADGTGGVTPGQVRDQLRVLNTAFGGATAAESAATPFTFRLAGLDYTANDDWYDWSYAKGDNDDNQAKRALHQGGMRDLNLYITGLADGLLGYATFPFQGTLAVDGVVLLNESLPGGDAAPYNEGDTGTHEVGHWLGLYHTFQDGCGGKGDRVDDTPAQLDGDNIFYCNESDDTCSAPGTDPVHNFMSYGDDPCLDRFTAGQSTRMVQTWLGYRAGK